MRDKDPALPPKPGERGTPDSASETIKAPIVPGIARPHETEPIKQEQLNDEERRGGATFIPEDVDTDRTEHESDPDSPGNDGSLSFGRYQWLRAHAEGGLGKVSIALDTELNREVAFKQIKPDFRDSVLCQMRFLREAQITASLEHPGIVPVYGMSKDTDGRPYYAMRFIQGDSLKVAIGSLHELPAGSTKHRTEFRRLLRHFMNVCNTIEYAHSRHIIHRDLKPGNIMLGPYGETLVVDWGLGKKLESHSNPTSSLSTSDSSSEQTTVLAEAVTPFQDELTQQGQIIGTPGFMSPEQMCGRVETLGPATDIYSLGAILYCLLTGQSPFSGSENVDKLSKVLRGDFPKPRSIRTDVPPALEAICLRAMELNPTSRYSSAALIAADIEAWMADEPVSAHRESMAERSIRVARRYRSWALAGVLSLLLLSVGSIIALVLINTARYRANEQAGIATSLRLARESEATRTSTPVRSALLALSSIKPAQGSGGAIMPQSRAAMYNSLMNLDGRPYFFMDAWPRQILATNDGSLLTVNGSFQLEKWMPRIDQAERLWAIPDQEDDESALAPHGRLFAVGTYDGGVSLWNTLSNPPQKQTVQAHAMFIDFVGFDAMGRWLISCSGDQAIIWDVTKGQLTKHAEITLRNAPTRNGFVVAEDNRFMAVTSATGTEYFDLTQSPPQRLQMSEEDEGFTSIVQSDASGHWMITNPSPGVLRLWDLTKNPVEHRDVILNATDRSPTDTQFSDDGSMLVVGFWNGGLQLIRPRESDLMATSTALTPHSDRVLDIAFDQSGQQLATVCRDGTSRLWDLSSSDRYPFREVRGHDGIVHCAEFDAAGSLLTGGHDQVVRTFHRSEELTSPVYRRAYYGSFAWEMQFCPSGNLMVSGSEDMVQIRSLTENPSGDRLRQVHVGGRRGTGISNDERWLVTCDDGHFRSFDLASSTPERVVSEWDGTMGQYSVALSFSPNDDYFIAGSATTLLWRFKDGHVIGDPQQIDIHAFAVRFSPDGNWLAISPPSSLELFRIQNGVATPVMSMPGDIAMVKAIDFSPDSKMLAWAGADGRIRLWSLAQPDAPTAIRELPGHLRGVSSVRISPNGRWLASSGNNDGTVRLWDLASSDATTSSVVLRGNWGQALSVDFDYQTQWLAASFEDGFVRCWNLDHELVAMELRKRAGRELSEDEKSEYVLLD